MKEKEDIVFYEDQRDEKKSSRSGMDKVFVRSVKRQVVRRQRDVPTTSTASTASWSRANVLSSEVSADSAVCRQRGVVVRSVVFTTTMIARLMVHLPN